MPRDPGSLWSPLPESGKQGTGIKTQFIVHSTGDRGSAKAIFGYFSRAAVVVESTFVIGLSPADPTRQMLDSSEVADANLKANTRAISVEVVGAATDPFTDWQISELIRLGRWAGAQHPIPAQICPAWDQPGLGWHVMFGAPGPWTPVAKDCPGKTRIDQLKTIVFPALMAAATPSEDDDMLLIRQPRGDVALILGDRSIPIGNINDYTALTQAGIKVVTVTPDLYNGIIASTGSEG